MRPWTVILFLCSTEQELERVISTISVLFTASVYFPPLLLPARLACICTFSLWAWMGCLRHKVWLSKVQIVSSGLILLGEHVQGDTKEVTSSAGHKSLRSGKNPETTSTFGCSQPQTSRATVLIGVALAHPKMLRQSLKPTSSGEKISFWCCPLFSLTPRREQAVLFASDSQILYPLFPLLVTQKSDSFTSR